MRHPNMNNEKLKAEHVSRSKPLGYSIFVSCILAVMKIVGGIAVNSLAILSSAIDSLIDTVSSTINYMALKKAGEPPDFNHKYGHFKFESLAAYTQSIFLIIIAIYIFYAAINKLIQKETIHAVNAGIIIMFLSMIITFFLVRYLNKKAIKYNSALIKTDAIHYKTDIFTNLGILVSLIMIKLTKLYFFDPIISILISFYIIYVVTKILLNVSSELLDAEVPGDIKNMIINTLRSHTNDKIDYHDLRTRMAGNRIFIDMHLILSDNSTLIEAHNISNQIESSLKNIFDNIDITIHMEPSKSQR